MSIDSYFRSKEKILIFGTGAAALNFIKYIKGTHTILAFMDNDEQKHGKKIKGIEVVPPNDIIKFPGATIVIASDFFDEIHEGLKKNQHFFDANIIYFRALELQQPTSKKLFAWFQDKAKNLLCKMPRIILPTLRKLLNARGFSIGSIVSLDEDKLHRKLIFRDAAPTQTVGPNFINGTQTIMDVVIPEVCLYQYFSCQISIPSRAFKTSEDHVVIEKVHTVSDRVAVYNRGHLTHHYRNKLGIVKQESSNVLSKGLLINGFYDLNYYHWLIDIIPQLQYLDELPEKYADFPILISEMADKIRSIKELLSLFNIKRKIIYLRSTHTFVVGNLLLISSPNRCCPRIIGTARSAADSSYIRRESIHFLRDLVLNKSINCEQSLPKKVFLAPSMKHRKYNQDEVFSRLQKYGFVKINPENMGLIEQASIFNNADLIVGPTGATWTNLVFAKDGGRALCWMAEEWGDSSVFSNLADAVNVGLQYLTYKAGVDSSSALYSKGYEINVNDIEKWVETHVIS